MKEESRRAALERLGSPEQIDRLLVIVRVPGWIALWCLVGLVVAVLVWSFLGSLSVTADGTAIFFDPRDIHLVQAEAIGVVEAVLTAEGDRVAKGTPLLTVGGKSVPAPFDGSVLTIDVLLGERVVPGTTLVWFHAKPPEGRIDLLFAFFPIAQGELVREGMPAQVGFAGVNTEKYGKLEGRVKRVLPFAASGQEWILRSLPSEQLREFLARGVASIIVEIEPVRDPKTASGLKWTTRDGPPYTLVEGSVGNVTVFVARKRPISYLICHD